MSPGAEQRAERQGVGEATMDGMTNRVLVRQIIALLLLVAGVIAGAAFGLGAGLIFGAAAWSLTIATGCWR